VRYSVADTLSKVIDCTSASIVEMAMGHEDDAAALLDAAGG
jgi:hypothetical protein